MPRTSRTPYAILGALSQGPMSGYDVRQLFDREGMFFWNESYGQIYPILKRLHSKGHVEMKVEERAVGPERKLYSLTDEGRAELLRWLRQPATPHSTRDEYLLKLHFAQAERPSVALASIEKLRDDLEAAIERLSEERAVLQQDPPEPPERLYRDLTMRWAEIYHEARLKWCQEAIEQMQEAMGTSADANS